MILDLKISIFKQNKPFDRAVTTTSESLIKLAHFPSAPADAAIFTEIVDFDEAIILFDNQTWHHY
jgi:hypothetical protein